MSGDAIAEVVLRVLEHPLGWGLRALGWLTLRLVTLGRYPRIASG